MQRKGKNTPQNEDKSDTMKICTVQIQLRLDNNLCPADLKIPLKLHLCSADFGSIVKEMDASAVELSPSYLRKTFLNYWLLIYVAYFFHHLLNTCNYVDLKDKKKTIHSLFL